MKIDPKLADLRYEKVRETVLGRHVTYQQYHAGKPVSGAWIRVDIDKDGHVYNVTNDVIPMPVMNAARKRCGGGSRAGRSPPTQLTEREAVDRAIASAGPAKETEVLAKELCYFQSGGGPTLAWKVVVQTRQARRRVEDLPGRVERATSSAGATCSSRSPARAACSTPTRSRF